MASDPHALERDALTGLLARPTIERLLEGDHSEPVTVVAFDLDGFREANDRLGDDIGDSLLIESADRLERLASSFRRRSDPERARVIATGRLGDSEFCAVVVGGPESVAGFVDHLLGAFRSPLVVDLAWVTLTVSVGIAASAAPEGANGHRITQWASRAARVAGAQGGDRAVVYSFDMSPAHRAQLAVEQLLLDR